MLSLFSRIKSWFKTSKDNVLNIQVRNSLMKREDEADAEKKKLQNRCHNLEEKSVRLHSDKVHSCAVSLSVLNLQSRETPRASWRRSCAMRKTKLRRWSRYHEQNQLPQILIPMFLQKFPSVPLQNSSHVHFPLKTVQVNRNSKSRAKRSDNERQRLMNRCQSLKESGAQAIAEKVPF